MTVMAVVFVFIYLWGWLFRPELPEGPLRFTPEQVAKAEQRRDETFDADNPPRVYQYVDYSLGEAAGWWPRGESPVLAELVQEGLLPPMHERTGPKPVVLEGVDGIGQYGGSWMYLITGPGAIDQILPHRLSYPNLDHWTHYGYPIDGSPFGWWVHPARPG